jgi:16S rRNA (guanine1207-N2)-methyltransferase
VLDSRFAGRSHYGVEVPAVAFDCAVLFLPKSRELAAYLLNAWRPRLAGRELYLVGEKRGGIEGAAKQLQAFGKPRKLDSARHCQLWQVTVDNAPRPSRCKAWPSASSCRWPMARCRWSACPACSAMVAWTGHGTVAGAPRRPAQRPCAGLRLRRRRAGCSGQTPLPTQPVTLLDVDAFAVAASRLTLAANNLEGEVISGDGIDAAPADLDLILSNPPFHTGVQPITKPRRTC